MTKDIVKTPGKYRTGGEGVVDGNENAISESNKNSDSTIFVTLMLKMIDLSVTKLISDISIVVNNTNIYINNIVIVLKI